MVKCFNYVNQLKNEQGQNIVATNSSWGRRRPPRRWKRRWRARISCSMYVRAGNGGTDAPHYPAAYDLENIISVAATDHSDLYAGFSNYGDTVDLLRRA